MLLLYCRHNGLKDGQKIVSKSSSCLGWRESLSSSRLSSCGINVKTDTVAPGTSGANILSQAKTTCRRQGNDDAITCPPTDQPLGALSSLGAAHQLYDANCDGVLDFDEFSKGITMCQLDHLFPRSLQRTLFDRIDGDKVSSSSSLVHLLGRSDQIKSNHRVGWYFVCFVTRLRRTSHTKRPNRQPHQEFSECRAKCLARMAKPKTMLWVVITTCCTVNVIQHGVTQPGDI